MHASRSWAFEQYLRRQPLERRLLLIAKEKEWSRDNAGRVTAVEQAFWESMHGHNDPVEARAIDTFDPASLGGDTGDWSWKSQRDKVLGDHMITFRGVPPGAAEAMHKPIVEATGKDEFQANAIAAHKAAGDYNNVSWYSGRSDHEMPIAGTYGAALALGAAMLDRDDN